MINFSIPDFFFNFDLNVILLYLMENEKEKFYDDIKIDSIYGSFPCIWNGGRAINGGTHQIEMKKCIEYFNKKNISIRHTFTNSLLTEDDLRDHTGNLICKLSENSLNGINVFSSLMYNYIKTNYPKFYLIWSTTLGEKNIDKINELSEKDLLVLDYNLNKDFKTLKKLKHPENVEILVNEICVENCTFRQKHYEFESNKQLNLLSENFTCPHQVDLFYTNTVNRKHYITINSIYHNYLDMGINKFKIMGRGRPLSEIIEYYVLYFVKPEYQNEIRQKLLIAIFESK